MSPICRSNNLAQARLDRVPDRLAEKPKHLTVSVAHNGDEIAFCRCPCCVEEFRKRPDELLERLRG